MEKFLSPTEYNQHLLLNKSQMTITEYIKELNELFYHNDISFMEIFMELIKEDKCCINYKLLTQCEIYSPDEFKDFEQIIKNNQFVENVDYVKDSESDYILHPDTFQKLLISCKKGLLYLNYFILLQKSIKYYNLLQIEMSNQPKSSPDNMENIEESSPLKQIYESAYPKTKKFSNKSKRGDAKMVNIDIGNSPNLDLVIEFETYKLDLYGYYHFEEKKFARVVEAFINENEQ